MYVPVCTQLFFIFVCVSACSYVSAGAHLEVRGEPRVLTLIYCLIWDRISYHLTIGMLGFQIHSGIIYRCILGIWTQVFDHWATLSTFINTLIKLGGTWIRMKNFLAGCRVLDRKFSKSRVQSKYPKRSIKLGKHLNWQEQGCVIQQIAFQFVGLSALLLPGIQGQSKCQLSIEGFQLFLLAWKFQFSKCS